MSFSIKRRLNIGFAFAILLVLLVGAISFAIFQKQYKYNEGELVKHTYKVINQLQSIQNTLIDMETGRRGFRSTNEKKFLQPYQSGLKNIDPSLTTITGIST